MVRHIARIKPSAYPSRDFARDNADERALSFVASLGAIMYRSWIAALVWAASAVAAVAQPYGAADFAAPSAMREASISPDGRYVAALQTVEQGEALVVVDWRTRRAEALQVARIDRCIWKASPGKTQTD